MYVCVYVRVCRCVRAQKHSPRPPSVHPTRQRHVPLAFFDDIFHDSDRIFGVARGVERQRLVRQCVQCPLAVAKLEEKDLRGKGGKGEEKERERERESQRATEPQSHRQREWEGAWESR